MAETRFFWNKTQVKQKTGSIEMRINLGVEYQGKIVDCPFVFTYRDAEVIYSAPEAGILKELDLIRHASALQFHLLYPMSGIETEETLFQDGWIKTLLGQGQTAQVLRNICYKVAENDRNNKTNDWGKIAALMERLFLVKINKPEFIESGAKLVLSYRPKNMPTVLDISLAGRGLQQTLLILAYLYWHKNSIVLIDEPDAHLEILRQRQIYALLKSTAQENGSQVIIATHSEAILDDAVDTNLTMLLLDGSADNLGNKKEMRNALRTYGIDHYYNARVHPRIFYIEGSTDIEILRALAKRLGHREAERVLGDKLNLYYTQNIEAKDSLENQMDRIGGAFANYRAHFSSLNAFVNDLKGLALFDGDNRNNADSVTGSLSTVFWKEYEIENYFITPAVLFDFIADRHRAAQQDLFMHEDLELFQKALDEVLLNDVFGGGGEILEQYRRGGPDVKRFMLRGTKMSGFAEGVFQNYARKMRQPLALTKSEFHRLVPFCPAEEIPREVTEKLDHIVTWLDYAGP